MQMLSRQMGGEPPLVLGNGDTRDKWEPGVGAAWLLQLPKLPNKVVTETNNFPPLFWGETLHFFHKYELICVNLRQFAIGNDPLRLGRGRCVKECMSICECWVWKKKHLVFWARPCVFFIIGQTGSPFCGQTRPSVDKFIRLVVKVTWQWLKLLSPNLKLLSPNLKPQQIQKAQNKFNRSNLGHE